MKIFAMMHIIFVWDSKTYILVPMMRTKKKRRMSH
jgi:hypothetical protein